MRILDKKSDQSLKNIILYLTNDEALELLNDLESLIQKPLQNHIHITSGDLQHEITVCVYDQEKLQGFDARSIKLIRKNE